MVKEKYVSENQWYSSKLTIMQYNKAKLSKKLTKAQGSLTSI